MDILVFNSRAAGKSRLPKALKITADVETTRGAFNDRPRGKREQTAPLIA
jgi:hypothetical protein